MSKSRSLPAVTHLQFLVLGITRSQEQSGRAIREILSTYGVKRTAPAFYQLMSRLEQAGLVEGRYEQIVVGDQAVTERRYRITAEGQRLWERAHDFYAEVGRRASKLRWSNA
jgi:DNA-binding PadR family transcriptional regulator